MHVLAFFSTRPRKIPLKSVVIVVMAMPSITGFSWACVFAFGLLVGFSECEEWSVDDNGCRTPDRGTGNCVPIMDCQPMVDLLQSLERPIAPTVSTELQGYTCGSESGKVKVCCPPGPINLKLEPSIPFHLRMTAPDVTNHRNINLLPESCGILDTTTRIVNGNASALNEFPWMALLRYRLVKQNRLEFFCGGTIINKNYILTAAHCLEKTANRELVSVRIGEHSIKNETDCERRSSKKIVCNPPVQDLAIEEIISHPQYGGKSGRFINDIGLIRVAPMNLNVESARPICMPIGVVRDFPYRRVIVTGWGVTNPWTGETADILQKVGLPVADKASCVKMYNESGIPLTNTQVCVGGDDGKDSCGGDSGGPMLVPTPIGEDFNVIYVQQGIVSFGPRMCADPAYPGIYTAVKYYMDWILDNMKQ